MTYNLLLSELMGEEFQRQRMQEADKERLIRQVLRQEPSLAKKVFTILRARWSNFWDREIQTIPPITHMPKNSTTL